MIKENMDETIPLSELHVLSPMAWVQREKEELSASQNLSHDDFLKVLADDMWLICNIADTMAVKECQLNFEKYLIDLAAHAILWLEDIRRKEK